MSVLLPKPFSLIDSNASSSITTSTDTAISSSLNVIALTPVAVLPIGLTSSSLNLMQYPFCVTIIISLFPLVIFTSISSSSSLKFIAINPPFLIEEYLAISVFLIIPFLVHIIKCFIPSISFNPITACIFSLFSIGIRFIIFVPLAVLPASGIS
ncbi:hypothetical protein ND00_06350 [Clostridium sp. L74]|nr:hypothetical protein ND00_06350 [Clostridium sp. L74]